MLETIKKIQKGDHNKYREIVREYGPAIRVYLAGRLTDNHTIDDLSQEIFIAAFWNLDRFDQSKDFGLWLRGIARNKLLNHLRKVYSNNRKAEELRLSIEESLQPAIEEFNHNEGKVIEQLKECLTKLPAEMHEIVQSRYYSKETVIKLAERLNTTVSAISSKLYRIRKQLRQCIEGATKL